MNIAIFASGGGSNFQAIADGCADGTIPARVVLCVASRADAGVIDRAKSMAIPHVVLEGSTEEWSGQVLTDLKAASVDLIALAGFMKMVPTVLIKQYPGRIVNIHPSLLPDFGGKGMYGMNVHQAVIASGKLVSGATVHVVDEDYDTGPIVAQKPVPVHPDDSPEDLAARILSVEHQLYTSVVKAFAEGRVEINDNRVTIHSERPDKGLQPSS